MTRTFALFLFTSCAALAGCKSDPDDSTGSESASSTSTSGSTGTTSTTATAGSSSATTGSPTTTVEPTTAGPTDTGAQASTGEMSTGEMTGGSTGGGDQRCTMYCAEILATCTGPNAQYASLESCVGVCGTFRPGKDGDVSGNSFACRAYHTGAAMMDADTHCIHAGPGGGGACGDPCEGFCTIAASICPGEYPDPVACGGVCAGFDASNPYDAGDASGDTLACRLYHLTVAATDAAAAMTHCPHTLADSAPCK